MAVIGQKRGIGIPGVLLRVFREETLVDIESGVKEN